MTGRAGAVRGARTEKNELVGHEGNQRARRGETHHGQCTKFSGADLAAIDGADRMLARAQSIGRAIVVSALALAVVTLAAWLLGVWS